MARTGVRRAVNLRFAEDYLFSSPSLAAMTLLGRTSNGRVEWKNASGTT
jgi:hypothetical protein